MRVTLGITSVSREFSRVDSRRTFELKVGGTSLCLCVCFSQCLSPLGVQMGTPPTKHNAVMR